MNTYMQKIKIVAKAYSVKNNFRTLFIRENDRWAFLDGYRAIGIAWVILGHCFISLQGHFGMQKWGEIISEVPAYLQWIFNGDVAVDGFLMVSAFLMSNILMRQHQLHGKLGIQVFYLSRFLRLTPAYFFALLIYYLFQNTEEKNVLFNFFYIQNFVQDYDQYFLPLSWSLAVEEQFYLLLPPFLAYVLLRSKRPFFHIASLLLASFLIRAYVIFSDEILSTTSIKGIIFDHQNFGHYFVVLYDNLYTRFGAFICGIAVAFAYRYRNKESLALLNKPYTSLITIAMMIVAIYLCWLPVLMKGFELPQEVNIFLNIARRNIVCMSAAWLLFCGLFSSKQALRFNTTMSLKLFYPFGHLLYSMYLFHYISVAFVLGNMKLNFRLFDIDFMQNFGWWMFLAFILSFMGAMLIALFSFLFIEAPIMNLRPKNK